MWYRHNKIPGDITTVADFIGWVLPGFYCDASSLTGAVRPIDCINRNGYPIDASKNVRIEACKKPVL